MSFLGVGLGGCVDAIVGEWDAVSVDGQEVSYVFTHTDFYLISKYDGYGEIIETFERNAVLIVWPDLLAQYRFYVDYTVIFDDGHTFSGTEGYVSIARV